ncbi:MAG: glycosyltransferase family 39 protein [Anaerolineae bacterium]|nr:glycosyltransferase family 39 protein [Anaerolineae bacterium]
MRRRIDIPLIAILALAAFLRLWNLDAGEFKFDEARVSNLAAHWIDGGALPLTGMTSSTGIANPPLTVYLIALPVLLSRDPLAVTAFVALLNVAGVWATYALGCRFWDRTTGRVAAALLAVSPWAVFYARKVWAQDLLLPLVVLSAALLLAWAVEARRWALAGAVVAVAALVQIHFAALALAPVLLLAVLLTVALRPTHRRLAWWGPPLLAGLAAGALLYAPYLAFDARHGWANVRGILSVARGPSTTQWNALRYALLNVGGREIHALAGPERYEQYLSSVLDLRYWPARIEEGLLVASALYLLLRLWRLRARRPSFLRDGVLLLWLCVPVLFYLRSRSPVYPHYLVPLYPAPYLAIGAAAHDLLRRSTSRLQVGRLVRGLAALLGAILVAWQVHLSLSIYAFVERYETPGGAGTPIAILRQVSATLRSHAREWGGGRAIVYCPGDDPATQECPAFFEFVAGRAVEVRFVDQEAGLLYPAARTDTLLVLSPGADRVANAIAPYAAALPGDTVWLRERSGAYRFYRLPAGQAPRPPVRPSTGALPLDNGVSLLGYGLSGEPAPGEALQLSLYWQVRALPDSPPGQGYSFANHLLTLEGLRVGQRDGEGYPVAYWREGDTVVSWFEIAVDADAPPAPYVLRTGMYIYTPPDHFRPVYVLDPTGHPVSDAADWIVN